MRPEHRKQDTSPVKRTQQYSAPRAPLPLYAGLLYNAGQREVCLVKPLLLAGLVCTLGVAAWGQSIRPAELAPMRWVEQVVPEDLPKLKYPGFADPLDKAKVEMQAGRYKLALQTLYLAEGIDPAKRALLLGETLCRMGRFAEAQAVLTQKEIASDGRARMMLAEAMADSGRRKDAVALLQSAIGLDPGNPLLHWSLARTWRSMGQLSAEKEALRWFAEQSYAQSWRKDSLAAIDSADVLLAIAGALDRLAVLSGEYRENRSLHQDVLNMLIRAYDEIDRKDADAHVAAAEFFLAHDDAKKAQLELERALQLNPSHLDALEIAGEQALRLRNAAHVQEAMASMRGVNPDHPVIRLLNAGMLMLLQQREEALQVLMQAQNADPDGAAVMAMLAACDAMSGNPEDLAKRLAQADAMMPQESAAHVAAAQAVLATGPQRAIPLLEQAITRTPHWNLPRNMLAIALMTGTDTEKARPVLESAYDLDPFSVETTNYLRLLDRLKSFQTNTSEHYAVRFDPVTDPFLADEVLSYMESNFTRICGGYKHEPQERTFIELMPENQDFSVRATGRPSAETYAVTLGPVITIIAPRNNSKTIGQFDWSDVLRHEFVHTVTLSETQGRIPRWFTEGLAVSEQTTPLWTARYRLLAQADARNRLLPVNALDQAIVTASNPELGYSQGHWICRYVEEKKGHQTILDMLEAYRAGMSTNAVFQKCLGVSTPEFDVQFAQWAKSKLKQLGLDKKSQQELAALAKHGNDLIMQKDYKGACEVWEKAHALCPVNLEAHQRLAGLYLHKEINQPEKALPHLQALDAEQLKDNRYAMRLSKLYLQLGKANEALASARRACRIHPYDADARQLLIQALTRTSATDEVAKQEKIVAWLNDPARKPGAGAGAPESETPGE